MNKTVFFESRYDTNIKKFMTMSEIDEFIAGREGTSLDVDIMCSDVITNRGDVFPLLNVDIDKLFDTSIGE